MQIIEEINSELILAYHKFTLVLFVEIGVLFAQIDCLNLGCACSGSKLLKVSKFQKQIIMFSFEPKNERNYFVNSALASKMGQIKKMEAL